MTRVALILAVCGMSALGHTGFAIFFAVMLVMACVIKAVE